MTASQELVEFAKQSHQNALQVVGMLVNMVMPPVQKPVTIDMSADDIIHSTRITTGLLSELVDVPSLSGKLSTNLDKLVEQLRKGK